MPRGSSKYNPRRASSSRRNKARGVVFARGLPCAICGRPIDYSIPYRVRVGDRWVYPDDAPELDEIIPVSRWREGPWSSPEECALDPENHQAVHRGCNRAKSNRYIGAKPYEPKKPVQTLKKHKQWREW